MSAIVLTAEELTAHLVDWGIPEESIYLPDRAYVGLDQSDAYGEVSVKARTWLATAVGNYEAEDADCDDFAEAMAFFIHKSHRDTLEKPRETAVAFGEFWYTTRNNEGHAICWFIDVVNGAWKLFFLEPQGCLEVTLIKEEIQSCAYLRA